MDEDIVFMLEAKAVMVKGLPESGRPTYHAGGVLSRPSKARVHLSIRPKAMAYGRSFSKMILFSE